MFVSQAWIAPRYCGPGAGLRITICIAVWSLDLGRFARSWSPRSRFLGDDFLWSHYLFVFCHFMHEGRSITPEMRSAVLTSTSPWSLHSRHGLGESTTKTAILESFKWPLTPLPRRYALKISPTKSTLLLSCLSCNSVGHHFHFLEAGLSPHPFCFRRSPSHHFSTRARRSLLYSVLLPVLLEDLVLWSRCIQLPYNRQQHSTFFSFKVRMGQVVFFAISPWPRDACCMVWSSPLELHTHVRRVTVAFEENNT